MRARATSGEYSILADVLARSGERSPSGALSAEWVPVGHLWVKHDEISARGTGEVVADRGAKATVVLLLLACWFPGWQDLLTATRRLDIEGRTYDIRSVVEAPARGSERVLRLDVQAVVS